MIKLANTIKVLVPVTNNDGVKVDLGPEIKNALKVIGGATTYTARGNWLDNSKLYTDNINVMQFNIMDIDDDVIRAIIKLVCAIFTKAEQLAVSVEINGVLYILEDISEVSDLF